MERTPMKDSQIKYMVDRFLMWKLPDNFSPDNGISAVRHERAQEDWRAMLAASPLNGEKK